MPDIRPFLAHQRKIYLETLYDENARPTLLPDVPCYIVLRKNLRNFTKKAVAELVSVTALGLG